MMEQFERMDKEQQEEMGRYKRPLVFCSSFFLFFSFRYKRPLMLVEDVDTKAKNIP